MSRSRPTNWLRARSPIPLYRRPPSNCREDCVWGDRLGLSFNSDWVETIGPDVIPD